MMHANGDGWDVFVDAAIAGGAAAVGALTAAFALSGAFPTSAILYGAGLAFLVAFFGGLAVARRRNNIKPPEVL